MKVKLVHVSGSHTDGTEQGKGFGAPRSVLEVADIRELAAR